MKPDFEKAFSDFLDRREYDQAESALFVPWYGFPFLLVGKLRAAIRQSLKKSLRSTTKITLMVLRLKPTSPSKSLITFSVDKEVAYIGVTGYLYSCADVQEPATAGSGKATPSGVFDRTLCVRSRGLGEPQQATGNIQKDIAGHCLLAPRNQKSIGEPLQRKGTTRMVSDKK